MRKAEYERAIERREDLGSTHPDGSLRIAMRIKTHAFQSYQNALLEYNRFILDRMPPIG